MASAAAAAVEGPSLSDVMAAIKDMGGRIGALEAKSPRTLAARPRVPVLHDGRNDLKSVADRLRKVGDQEGGVRGPATDSAQRAAPLPPAFADGETVTIDRDATREGAGRLVLEQRVSTVDGTTVDERTTDVRKGEQATRRDETQHLSNGQVVERRYRTLPLSWGEIIDRMPSGGVTTCKGSINKFPCRQRVRVGEVCDACGFGPYVLSARLYTKLGEWKYRVVVPGMTSDGHPDGFLESELLRVSA